MDFNYDDTSGEVRDQRAEHEVRLAVMNALSLEDDLAASGRSSRSELSKAADAAEAIFNWSAGFTR